ncbi:MAG: T9SS type A sorting domain-containing protein [Deferribacteres bacterium]|nr:T9SS type A sorting domain-containing protein [candidate division KSB1 bacterium]MCB9501546.1 T9SS type A sorting domain-containing protein [Deferribacteres bacterium]
MRFYKPIFLLFMFFASSFIMEASTAVISHRGAAGLAPENTLAACRKAIELGADYFEVDVRVSSDDSLLIMHDESIDRTTNGSGNIVALPYATLRRYDAGSWFGSEFTGQQIPTLNEVLNLALNDPNKINVVIELKANTTTLVQRVIDAIQARNMQDQVVIASFNLDQISEAKSIDPSIPVMLFATVTITQIKQVEAIGGEWLGTGGGVTQALLDSTHARGMFMNKWTVNSAEEMRNLVAIGVDGITTDNPHTAIAVMDETPPSDVVLTGAKVNITKVRLSWEPATDAEGGISGYEIYRDTAENATTLLTTVGDTTSYIDDTMSEEATFYYRIKAMNTAGLTSLNYSNELSATTEADKQAPDVGAISAFGPDNVVVVEFNERVDKSGAEEVANYQIDNDVVVNSATLSLDSTSVLLKTSSLSTGVQYNLSVNGISDLAVIPNVIVNPVVVQFEYNPLLDQTIGAWDFDQGEGTTLMDISGNGNDGNMMNGISWSGGYVANGLQFDGVDDYVEFTNANLDVSGNAVSVSVWINLAYSIGELPVAYAPVFDSDADNYVIYGDKGNNELRFKVSTDVSAERPGIPGADITANEWLHVVGVYDGATAQIYLNGELKDSHNLTGNVRTGQLAFLGRTGAVYFEGRMDNVFVFDRALTEEEINFLFSSAKKQFIDTIAPEIDNVASVGSDQTVYVHFNEKVSVFSAETISNYAIDNGVTIMDAKITADRSAVILTTSPLLEDVAYTITVSNIEDQAEEPNVIEQGTQIHFSNKRTPENLVSYWSLDEGADTTAYDATANSNNGTLKNGTVWADSKFGNGLLFDGVDDYVLIPSTTSLNIDTNAVTLSVWAKLDYLPADLPGPYGPIYDSDTDNYVIYMDRGNNELRFKVTTVTGAQRPGIPADALTTGEWLHIAGVYDGVAAKIYLNGKLQDTLPLTGNIKTNSGDIFLGRTGTTYFSGGIDHIQIFDRALNAQEVVYLYSGTPTPVLSLDKVEESTVSLSWEYMPDPVSGVSGYHIYRDTTAAATTLIATVGDTTAYTDIAGQELDDFYYRIKAIDANGVESDYFSNEVIATTGADNTPPALVKVSTTGEPEKVLVNFSEPVDSVLAESISNYAIDNGAVINAAKISAQKANVLLSVTGLTPETDFTLTVNNITDLATVPNTIASDTKALFQFYPYLGSLISYWPLDEGMDTLAADVTGNGNNGILQNGPQWVDGVFGNALSFDGVDDQVEITNSILNIDSNAVSVSLWVKLAILPPDLPGSFGPIFDSETDNYVIYEDRGNNELRFKVTTFNGAERPGIPGAELVKDEWMNVIGVYDGAEARVYLNGVLKDTHPLTGNVKPGDIVTMGYSLSTFFKGCIDNIYVFDRALSDDEITYLATGENYPTSVHVAEAVPTDYSLSQNYPNPFNPTTTLFYSIPQKEHVTITIYDAIGRVVRQLINEKREPGTYRVVWDGRSQIGHPVTSGIYLYRIQAGRFTATKKMILVR